MGGQLEIQRRIGEGGMGVVYQARDARRRADVALKTLSRLEPEGVYRLKQEFRSLAEVRHPNLCQLYELFSEDEWFFTMELIEGQRFDRWVRPDGALSESRLRAALPQLVEAVAAIHRAGKLHRDLKPSNVLVSAEGRVVVLDFGLSVDSDSDPLAANAGDDSVSGTPAYMAPEQAGGAGAVPASDVYALGVMLFEALTGQRPFEGRTHQVLAEKQLASRAARARALCPGSRGSGGAVRRAVGARARTAHVADRAPGAAGHDAHTARASARALARARRGAGAAATSLREHAVGGAVAVFVAGESGMARARWCSASSRSCGQRARPRCWLDAATSARASPSRPSTP
jgi:predicted Ser/Thr protein kinase